MITDHMKLTTTADAHTWADSILSGISSNDYDYNAAVTLLAAWIWDQKPSPSCNYSEHPINSLNPETLWEIIANAEVQP